MKIKYLIRLFLAQFLLSIVFIPAAFSTDLWPMFHKLKHVKANFKVEGTVCEQVARIEMEEEFGTKNHVVFTGIVYRGANRTLGELDVIVFRKSDAEAILVAEVKCWRKLSAARKKAKTQLERFDHYINSNLPLDMYLLPDGNIRFKKSQFDESPQYIAISQQGGRQYGFEKTIQFTLSETKQLRAMILDCQENGNCFDKVTH